jgi:hypothetical protein
MVFYYRCINAALEALEGRIEPATLEESVLLVSAARPLVAASTVVATPQPVTAVARSDAQLKWLGVALVVIALLWRRRRRVWGSNAPCRKYVSPAGSTRTKLTKRNLPRVTPVVRLLHVARTRRILLLPAGCTHRTVASCRRYPPHSAAQLQPTPVASIPLAGCAAILNTAVYDFMTNSRH